MNYRHIFHAGNFADVLKHALLLKVVEALHKKDKPLAVIDAHGGIGLYDLQSEQAEKTREYEGGIRLVHGDPAFKDYSALVDKAGYPGLYPGSPWFLKETLRPQDRLVANELHPEDADTLRKTLGRAKNIRVDQQDAYQLLKASLPPPERRGLFLIDPPFEKADEFVRLETALADWYRRFPTGVYMIWYPIKAHLAVSSLKDRVRASGFGRAWCVEGLKFPRRQETSFNGSGVILLNAPYPVPEESRPWLQGMKERLDLHAVETEWLTTA